MRQKQFFLCVCVAAILGGCGDDDATARTRVIGSAKPAPQTRPVRQKPPLDHAIDEAIKAEFIAQAAQAASADPNWSTYPILNDDSRRSEIPDEVPADHVKTYLRGVDARVPTDGLQDVAVAILPDRVELRLTYLGTFVELIDRSGSPEARQIPESWPAAAPVISDERWKEIGARAGSIAGADGTDAEMLAKRIDQYRQSSARWEPKFRDDYDSRIKFMKGALWSDPGLIARLDVNRAYNACRLLMSKTAVMASIPGPANVPVTPVLGGPVFGLRRGRAQVDREVHGVVCGADGVWIEVNVTGTDPAHPITQPEAWVNGFFDTLRPFEQRVNDAAVFAQKAKEAQKASDPTSKLRAALLAFSAFHLDPRAKRAENFVKVWRLKSPAPTESEMNALVEQIVVWAKLGPSAKKEIMDASKGKIPNPK